MVWLIVLLLFWPFVYAWSGVNLGDGQYRLLPINEGIDIEAYLDLFGFSLRNATLLNDPLQAQLNPGSQALQVLLRILSPFLALLLALAVRRRFRR